MFIAQNLLHWESDWNGYEVGFPEVEVVGLYTLRRCPTIHCYLDVSDGQVLEIWDEDNETG